MFVLLDYRSLRVRLSKQAAFSIQILCVVCRVSLHSSLLGTQNLWEVAVPGAGRCRENVFMKWDFSSQLPRVSRFRPGSKTMERGCYMLSKMPQTVLDHYVVFSKPVLEFYSQSPWILKPTLSFVIMNKFIHLSVFSALKTKTKPM